MSCTVAILVTLDTKGEEARYVKEYISNRGHRAIVIDCGVLGQPLFQPEVSREEVAAGRLIAERVNKAKGPVAIVIPKRGFSEWDKPGTFFYDPEAEQLFAEEIKKTVLSHVKIVEVDANINDPVFSDEVLKILDDMMRGRG